MSEIWAKCSPQKSLILLEIPKTESTEVRPTKRLLILYVSTHVSRGMYSLCINACESWSAIKVHSVPTKAESRVKWLGFPYIKVFNKSRATETYVMSIITF